MPAGAGRRRSSDQASQALEFPLLVVGRYPCDDDLVTFGDAFAKVLRRLSLVDSDTKTKKASLALEGFSLDDKSSLGPDESLMIGWVGKHTLFES